MIVYRSIGESELFTLINGSTVKGQFDCYKEVQCSSRRKNAICLFTEKIRWYDKAHCFFVVLDIPKEKLSFGKGIYYAAKTFATTKVWTGRTGSVTYELDEAYTNSYSIKNVKGIYLGNRYANWYREKVINPLLEKYHLKVLKTWDEEIE